jgi:peroxiredoxin
MASHRQRKLLDAGSHAPDFRLARLDGGETSLGEIAAQSPALLVFFKITCPVCQMALPYLERIHAAGGAAGAASGLAIYGISQNDAEDTREFMQEFGVTFPMLLDSEEDDFPASNAYGISSVPTMFLVERDGTLSRVLEGWQKAEIERLGDLAGVAVFRAGDNVPAWKAG